MPFGYCFLIYLQTESHVAPAGLKLVLQRKLTLASDAMHEEAMRCGALLLSALFLWDRVSY